MGELLWLIAEMMVNLFVWDDRLRHELRERHPLVFAFVGAAIVVAIALLAVLLFTALQFKD